MIKFIKQVFCGHGTKSLMFVRNVYGDEINTLGGKRSIWRCEKCGKWMYGADLYHGIGGGDE